ncbi:carbohydrate-binding module family 20 protein [Cucurbitaria berberidis CBS 394.84]|uniref:Carbohydrate-binding module family 20 protein n=1 Tax=Cucurbitaria berberidis CBS 394.84 TaxID=1168544 RepID=A0A9P4L3K6_9PLEO|nr:carbohydrate-binding module family 20 protein [Cucurbitaria berberidis CBS 394.84]KAF1840424.1 carbohydrate-binding module family 20 protein [Cucurbitaria berberidis CBS 394.84]
MKFSTSTLAFLFLGAATAAPVEVSSEVAERAANCVVKFNITIGRSTSFKMVGSLPELGNWNYDAAKESTLENAQFSYAYFSRELNLAPGTTIRYKYGRVDANTGQFAWDQTGERSYTAPQTCTQTIFHVDSWKF